MIVLRVLLGIFQSAIFPGLSYLVSTWYTRKEQQLRFAFLQSGEVIIVGLGVFMNFELNHLDGKAGLRGWRWMFLIQGLLAVGKQISYWWSLYLQCWFTSDRFHHIHLDGRLPRELPRQFPLPYLRGASVRWDSYLWWSWRCESWRVFPPEVPGAIYGPETLRFLHTLFLSERYQHRAIVLPSYHSSVWNGIFEWSVNTPLCTSILLRRRTSHRVFNCRWSLSTPRSGDHLQLHLHHFRVQHARLYY